ncbi:MAG: hypothetical protein J6Q36_02275 [Alistipes sp.]|jgi:hypothetical protein|nr:hypothetical protein [Alistipes sp.]
MSTENDERYTPEEESYDPEGIAELRRQEEEERLNRRIRREIIRIESGESDEAIEQERQRMEEEEEERKATEERKARRSRSILFNIFTGGFLSTDGATKYYRMLIAIAAMCFICIFLTFLSLNADREYRLLEKHAVVLRERAIIFEDRKYSISTREEVNRLMEKQGIELKDLDNDSHVIR